MEKPSTKKYTTIAIRNSFIAKTEGSIRGFFESSSKKEEDKKGKYS